MSVFYFVREEMQVEVIFRYFMHNLIKRSHKISFVRGPTIFSAIDAMSENMQMRGSAAAPFFVLC